MQHRMHSAIAIIGCIAPLDVGSGRIQQQATGVHLTPVVGIGVVDVEPLLGNLVDPNRASSASHGCCAVVLVRSGGLMQRLYACCQRGAR